MSLIDVDGDSWLREFKTIENLVSEINETTVRRRQCQLGDVEHSSHSVKLRKLIPQAELQLATTLNSLNETENKSLKELAPGERERRKQLCRDVQRTLTIASNEFYKGLPRSQHSFGKVVADLGTVNWNDGEMDENTRHFSNEELRNQQLATMQAQEESLNDLADVVGNQKRIATSIQTEVETQDDLLVDIKDRLIDTQGNLEQQVANTVVSSRSTSSCGYWVVIVILLVAIIIVATW